MSFPLHKYKLQAKQYMLCVCCFLPLFTNAQRYNFKNYSAENGLPYVQIFTIFQDSKGYLWSGGYGGLSQFNGKEFKNFSPKNGLANHYVNAIAEDKNQQIIIGTIDGLSVLKNKTITNYHVKDGLSSKNITSLCIDNKGIVWVGTSQGLCTFVDGKIKLVNALANKTINCLYSSYESGLWIGTSEGLYHYTENKFTLYDVDLGLANNGIMAIAENVKTKELFVGTKDGLSCLQLKTKKIQNYHVVNGLLDEEINALATTPEGTLWVGSKSGLINFDGKNFSYFTINSDNNSNIVRTLLIDYENNLWIGTHNGMYQFRDKGFVSYGKQEGLGGAFVFQIFEDEQKNIWLTTETNGVYKYNHEYFKNYSTKEGLNTINVISALHNDDGSIWFGTNKGISILKNDKFSEYPLKLDAPISCFFKDSKQQIWIGSLNGVCCLTKKNGNYNTTYYSIPTKVYEYGVWSISEDNSGNIWAGSYLAGIFKLENNKFINQDKNINHHVESALDMEFDDADRLYLATLNGVFVYDLKNKKGQFISEKDGLISELVYSIKITRNKKYLWAGTNQGISRIDISKLKQGIINIVSYTKADGFEGVECNTHGIYEDEQSNIWFGTVNGLVKYSPKEFKINDNHSKTTISHFQLGYVDTLLSQGVKLSASLNNITFFVDGISLTNSNNVRYTYKLEGFDKEYSPTTENSFIKYDNLPSGKYIFKVKSCNSEGMWNIEPTTFNFEVLTPIYKSWWFVLLVLSSVVASVFLFFQYRLKKANRKQQKIFEQKIEVSKSELKALRAQMNPHFVFNSLNSIQHYILNSKSEEAVKYLNKFAKLIRIILHNSEKPTVTINEDVESIKLYLELERMRFDNQFDYEIILGSDIDGDYDEIPPMLIQPYLENAILHGINPKEAKGFIKVNIEHITSFIKITIVDDGIGREKANALKSLLPPNKHKSLGMKITQDRLRILNTMQQSQLSVNIIDLYHTNKEALGTKIELFIPYIK